MHDACGTIISKAEVAGELHFDAEQLPLNLPENSCRVTIAPLKLNNKNGMVLFYFKIFRFEDACENMNVTIIDGDSNYGNVVNGLPRYVCGVNTLLEREGQFFTSSGRSLKVIYNADKNGVNKPGTFVMKFVSFHKGSCSGSDVHECSNGHCVPNKYACSSDFNVCGDTDNDCIDDKISGAVSSVATTIVIVIVGISFVLFTTFGLCMFCMAGRRNGCLMEICDCVCESAGRCYICARCCWSTRETCSSCGESFYTLKKSCGDHCADCGRSIRTKFFGCVLFRETNNNGTDTSGSGLSADANTVLSQLRPEQDHIPTEMTNDTSSSPSDTYLESEHDITFNSHVTPLAPAMQSSYIEDPPPTYDEAVAPSYKDYMLNKERYATHKHKRTK